MNAGFKAHASMFELEASQMLAPSLVAPTISFTMLHVSERQYSPHLKLVLDEDSKTKSA